MVSSRHGYLLVPVFSCSRLGKQVLSSIETALALSRERLSIESFDAKVWME